MSEQSRAGSEVTSSFEFLDGQLVRHLRLGSVEASAAVPLARPSRDSLGAWWRAYLKGQEPTPLTGSRGDVSTLELFCGSGGLALGFRQACLELGFTMNPIAIADQDREAVEVHRHNHGAKITTSASVSTIIDYHVRGSRSTAKFHYEPELIDEQWAELAGQVDVVLAGPPCQGHSSLNNQTRGNDRRNDLYLTVPAIAVALGVRTVVIENVPGVVHDSTGVVESTITLLEANGYAVSRGILNAARMGWPQTRDRFFLVASRETAPPSMQSVAKGLQSDPRSVSWALSGLRKRVPAHMVEQPVLSEENRRRIDWLFANGEHDLALAERPECHQDGTTYTAVYGRMHPDRPAPTITTGFFTPGRGRFIHPSEPRVLTAQEAARIQGFPDWYDFAPDPRTPPTKLKLAKWIGDAVPMPLGYGAGLAALSSLA